MSQRCDTTTTTEWTNFTRLKNETSRAGLKHLQIVARAKTIEIFDSKMSSLPRPRLINVKKLLLICALYCCLSNFDQQHRAPSSISGFANALLYHKYQPSTPLLSRTNRQPHLQQQQPQHLQQNATSDSYYHNYGGQAAGLAQQQQHGGVYNRQQQQQQQQPQQARQAEPQISYLRDSSSSSNDEEDTYGCPVECHCNKIAQIADCSNRNLTRVPGSFPKDIKRIRLERNNITEIGPYAFGGLRRLQRIDLSNNNLNKIDTLAFAGGLPALNSLILFSNKLEYVPVNVFSELSQLQLLLLNANSLQTIHKDLFQALTNLNLLSLYDNNIVTLASGTFDGLKSIKTIHLGKNPFNCDCNLRWLVDYLGANPTVETSEASCRLPEREQSKKLIQLNKSELKCQEQQPAKTSPAQAKELSASVGPGGGGGVGGGGGDQACPQGCLCNGNTVDCSHSPLGQESRTGTGGGGGGPSGGLYELPDVPDDLPVYFARVHINDSRIKRIRQTSLFRKLANSQKLDLGNNKIVDVEDNAINGQLPNGQRPDRVIFVLLENQQCEAQSSARPGARFAQEQVVATNSDVGGHLFKSTPQQQQQQAQNGRMATGNSARQHVVVDELADSCASAPKVNEPQFDSPCYNGGACKPARGNNFTCECPAGFNGPLCELNLDDCLDHQCQNGAMCVDGIDSYKCICRDPTTSGEFCEQLNPNNHLLFNSPPYATNSANSIAPLALPMLAQSNPVAPLQLPVSEQQQQQRQPQIQARSADFLRASSSDDLATNSLQVAPSASGKPTGGAESSASSSSSSCHRVTTSKYFDDANGCMSVRLLKMSECAGGCSDLSTGGGGCCAPTKIKRRRIHMQCSDGASYVKVVDLIKKCSCSQDVASCPANNELPFGGHATTTTTTTIAPMASSPSRTNANSQYFKYSTGTIGGGEISSTEYLRRREQPQASGRSRAQSYNSSSSSSSSWDQGALLRLDAVE